MKRAILLRLAGRISPRQASGLAACGFLRYEPRTHGFFSGLGSLATTRYAERARDAVGASGDAPPGQYVAWAVNGFFSVLGSLLTTMASMTWGFRAVLFGAFVIYLAACLALQALAAARAVAPRGDAADG